jgi:cell division protein FtsI/penicillin-binding protein 2
MLLTPIWRSLALWCLLGELCAAAQSPDPLLQKALSRAMAGRSGTAIIVDVHPRSRIVASYRLDVAERRLAYPGSAIKPFTLMALLQSGKLQEHSALVCRRHVTIAGHNLDCTHPQTQQPLDPADALAYSCNSYFTTVALRLTPEQLYDAFVNDGFTSAAHAGAAGWVEHAQSPAQLQLQAIGEWGIKITPLELAYGYERIAALQPKHDLKLAPVFAGLEDSVAFGMGHAAQPETPIKVAGKTGTAPAEEGPWTHAWFAGYAPADRPEIVVVVFLEKGHGGSEAAAVARAIFAAYAQSRSAQLAAAGTGEHK